MKIISFLFLLIILPIQISAQVTQEWVALNPLNYAPDIAVDKFGNSYIATGFNGDGLTIKYNSIGEIVWASTYNTTGNSNTIFTSIKVDSAGNVYVAGYSTFDSTNNDYITIKYNSSGVEQWVRGYNGPGNGFDAIFALAIDNTGNVYVTGTSRGAGTLEDYATVKYNSDGIEQWVRRYNASNFEDTALDIAVDNSGNVYATGRSYNTASGDYATIKYNSEGAEQWIRRYNSPLNGFDYAVDIKIDNAGNIYVLGEIREPGADSDFGLLKYNSEGFEQWVKRFNGDADSTDYPSSMAIDQNNNIFVTGSSIGNGTKQDIVTIKYDSNGNEQWFRRYNNILSNAIDGSSSIAVDDSGAVYVTGGSQNNITGFDYITLKYNSAGDEEWQIGYSSPENRTDFANAIAIDDARNIYVTGYSNNGGAATIKYSQTPPLQITKPTPYSKFIAGEKDTIKWTDPGWVAVNIKCKTNFETPSESEIILAQGIPNVNSKFVWNLPETLLSFRSKIIIENANNTIEKIESDIFRIKPYLLTRLNSDSTYYEYRKNRDQWGFSNTPVDMWPATWFNQFNYQGIDPFTNQQYSQIQGDSVFFKRPSFAHMDWVSWVNTFTVDACYFSVANGWYKPTATLKWWIKSFPGIWNGSCFGIAVANALAFSHREQFQTKYQNFPTFINPITVVSDTGVKRVVNELFTYQFGNPHKALRTLIGLEKTPNETLNDLKEMFAQDNSEIRTLSFLNNGGGGGHAVLAYKLKQDPTIDGLYYVHIYDNSNPNSNIPIQISTVSNGGNGAWGTAEPSWAGWGGNKWLYLRNPIEQYLVNPTLAKDVAQQSPFILDQDVLEINTTNSASIQIQDNFGNQTGFINNLVQLDIPGSAPFVFDNGSETPPYGYTLPADNYSVVLNEFIEDTVATFFFTGNKSFLYERSGATQTQTDRLFFDGGVSVANPDAQTKTVKILNLINETTQEKLSVIRSIELAQNDSVKIENPDSNKVKLISYGTAKEYDLELNYVTENGLERFGDFGIQLTANTSHTFVPNWTDITNTELMVLVDFGNDGTIDDTLSLVNQVTGIGEDQGLLLSPNSYNLAQNYPNPFNPSTTIKYSIPNSGSVTLKVYDVLGNEVATLVNEEKVQGVYSVTFDASHLSSGVYFYKIQAGNFVETKKMLLIK